MTKTTETLMQKTRHAILSHSNRGALISRNPHSRISPISQATTFFSPCRNLAQVQSARDAFPEVSFSFTSSRSPLRTPEECGLQPDGPPPDERILKLGKSKELDQNEYTKVQDY